MLDPKKIGEFIARLRKSKGLTQSALADLLSVTHQAVSKWENGAALPDLEVLMTMRQVFGVSVDDILDCRQPSSEPAGNAGLDESQRTDSEVKTDTVDEERIIIYGSRTFESSVSVDRCTVYGEARFKSDVQTDTMDVMGRTTIERALTADVVNIAGMANIGYQVEADVVNIQGRLSVGGGISCDVMENHGSTNCGGGVKCDILRNNGKLTMGGGIATDSLFNSGMITLGGGVASDTMENSGVVTMGGGIASSDFTSRGELSLGGGVAADKVNLSEQFRIGGALVASSIRITLSEKDCAVHNINADSLIVETLGDNRSAILDVREIKVEQADLTNVRADLVRVQKGEIGTGCIIARLECSPNVEILPGAVVVETATI